MGSTSRWGLPIAAIAVVIAIATLALHFVGGAPAEAGTRSDPNDAAGPLDIAEVRVRQVRRDLEVRIRTRGAWSAKRLRRFPSRIDATGERYMCLHVHGGNVKNGLVCPGRRRGRLRLGYSRVRDSGKAIRSSTFRAKFKRFSRRSIKIRFRPRKAKLRVGRFRWNVVSGWRGPACRPPTPPSRHGKEKRSERRRSGDAHLCLDRAPDAARGARGRVRPVHRSGCTPGSPSFATNGPRGKRRVALTFDDGPSKWTSKVLKVLRKKGAKGTFFVVGQEIGGRSSLLRKMMRQGHEIGNHSTHHSSFPSSGDLRKTSRKIKRASSFRPCRFRPPGGAVNGGLVDRARDLGMTTVNWDVDTRDWTTPGSGTIASRAVGDARPGSVILMHDGGGNRSQTVAALPKIIKKLKKRGYKLVTVTELFRERFKWRIGRI